MTELEERLASQDAQATHEALCARLDSLTKQLRKRMTEQLLTKDEFAQLTMLASASEIAQKVMGDFGSAQRAGMNDLAGHSQNPQKPFGEGA